MSDNKSMIKSIKELIDDINAKKEKLQNKYEMLSFVVFMLPISISLGIIAYNSSKNAFLSLMTTVFSLPIIFLCSADILVKKIENKISEEIQEKKLMETFLEQNEYSLMREIHNYLEKNNEISQYKELKIRLEQIKLECIKKNWKNIMVQLPVFLEDLNNEILEIEITINDKKKLDAYNTLLKYEVNIKEKEINYNL